MLLESPRGRRSVRERIRPHLEVDGLARRSLAALVLPWRAVRPPRPEAASLPPGGGIVDPAVDGFGVEPERVRHAQHGPLAFVSRRAGNGRLEGEQRAAAVTRRNLDVVAEAERVVLVGPVVI